MGLPIDGAALRRLVRHHDERGFFEEILRASDPFFNGFAQLSWCRRGEGVITAWHFHPTQWDWWFIARGSARVALHDMREGSPTRGVTWDAVLGEDEPAVLAIPNGVAHGYRVLRGPMELFYVTSREYNAAHPRPPEGEEGRLPYNDPAIGYDWSAGERHDREPR